MTGTAIRVWIPVESLGRVRVPHYRPRYREGWIRFGFSPNRRHVVATLEDREGLQLKLPTTLDVRAMSRRLAWAVCIFLLRYNKYQPGEDPGRADAIQVAVA